jgi:hypothetical protein
MVSLPFCFMDIKIGKVTRKGISGYVSKVKYIINVTSEEWNNVDWPNVDTQKLGEYRRHFV